MDFSFSEEHNLFRSTVANFVDREVVPVAAELDERGEFPEALFQRCGELGYFGIRYPEAVGGGGGDMLMFNLLIEELARGSLALAACVAMQCLMGTDFVYRFGTPDHLERLLKPALRGEKIGGIAMTEPNFGSDLAGIQATAVRDGTGWSISGQKMWVTSASRADFFTVAAKTDPAAGFKGIDMFLVERGMDGLQVGKPIHKLGTRASETAELALDNVRVPAENLLGTQGSGFKNLGAILAQIRVMTGALSLGVGRAALDASKKYANERVQFGKPIAQFQAIQHKLAEMATQLQAARWLVLHATWQIDQGKPDNTSAAMAKLFASEMANKVADEATRIFGSYGFAMEYEAQRYFRDARFLLYGGGTSEILRNVIAKELTGHA
jgi:butyryl-CoA dehydrogenase